MGELSKRCHFRKAVTVIPKEYVWGVTDPKPPKGFPDGKLRWRLRSGAFVLARVKTPDGIREFSVREADGYWVPGFETGRNLRE